jgi:hypothetical protein
MDKTISQLEYQPGDRYCPNHEVQTVIAEHFFHVSDKPLTHLEGLCFDRSGDLYFVEIYDGAIMKLDMKTQKLTEIYKDDNLRPAAVKIHKDGRLFIACVEMHGRYGCIMTMNPDGSNPQVFLPGLCVDDLVFDSKGGFYFTHFAGTLRDPIGGVYYVSPDMKVITPIFLIITVGLFITYFAASVVLLMISIFIIGFGQAALWSAAITDYTTFVPGSRIGTASGIYAAFLNVGNFVSAYFVGLIIWITNNTAPRLPIIAAAFISLVVLAIWFFSRVFRKPVTQTTP